MPLKFKAAILEEINKPLNISPIEATNLEIGQVLVRVLVSGLCGAQLQEIRGEKGNAKFVPHLLGHEGCGLVQEIGPGVTTVKPGDKVIMHWRRGNGIESSFPTYIYNDKKISGGKVTTLSEYTVASENRLTVVDNDIPDELCALLGCGLSTALGVINNDANIKFGETVVILGCGGVGLNLIQGAKLASATSIYAVDLNDDKKEIANNFGAFFINLSTDNRALEDIKRIDCIIDTTGSMELISRVLPNLSERGRVIVVGQPKQNSSLTFTSPSNFFLGEGQSIMSTQGGKINPSIDLYKYINLYKKGLLDVNGIITHTVSLDEINFAINLLKEGKAGRIFIKM